MIWLRGILRHRWTQLLASAAGLALSVALLAMLGSFLVSSSRDMTTRSIAAVPVDWQIQLGPGATPQSIIDAVGQTTPYDRLQQVAYADTSGFIARTGGTVQTTGPGKAVGLEASYRTNFPGQLRLLIGTFDGVLLAQQTAANLHATVGDSITIERPGLPAAEVKVSGIVDLPNADSMFQAIGVPPGLAPQAPPDNVVILPLAQWHMLFDGETSTPRESTQVQLHLRLARDRLPHDPTAAFDGVAHARRSLEARLAGMGAVANNLGARLDAVRGDALYARVLFLFLGAPGALLSLLLTNAVTASGAGRRRREQSLLRLRGASIGQIMCLVILEVASVGVMGIALGLALAALVSLALLGENPLTPAGLPWMVAAAGLGLVAAGATLAAPAWREARHLTVAGTAAPVEEGYRRSWLRYRIDLLLLAVAAALFWQMQRQGYQIVLAPEGVPATSVDYDAFLSPTLFWIALGLLSARLLAMVLAPGRRVLATGLRSLIGHLAGLAASGLARQQHRIAKGFVVVVLAMSFATSTAIFDATYQAQAEVDARLTNGADVTITGSPGTPAGAYIERLRDLPGVAAAEPMQHRFAYVGTDLQDLYGIDPATIGRAAPMPDAYFANGDAAATLSRLGETPDGILVSEETVQDYQLRPGDKINLRLLNARDHQYRKVPFHLVGVVREFPTAPRDSFLVANAAYVGLQTQSPAAELVLLRAYGDPAKLSRDVRAEFGHILGLGVSDVHEALTLVDSSLTAIDVRVLARIECGFALLMLLGAAGITFILDLDERQRGFAILAAIGAKPSQIYAFIWSEALIVFLGGSLIGLLAGFLLAHMLVNLLTGVFDPPPQGLTIPWLYLVLLAASMMAATFAASIATRAILRRPIAAVLRTA
jgi:putative ABC transport system permease protein